MKRVYNIDEAMSWFLSNSSGSVLCVNDGKEKECNSFPDATNFFNGEDD
jgi:hypothetical protein